VPDRARLVDQCSREGVDAPTFEQLLQRSEVRALYGKILDKSNQKLARYEQIKKFTLLPTEFTLEGGELTPTLKIKRRFVEEKYKSVIESMYTESKEA